jgi:rsbT co-antagonist protein RsbR
MAALTGQKRALSDVLPLEEHPYMASGDTNEEVTLLRQRIADLEKSEARYRNLYESSPISLWEEDWSAVKAHLNQLLASGVTDLDKYLASHVEDVFACVGMVKVIDVNKATLDLCHAVDKSQLLGGLHVVFNETALQTFHRELVAIGHGATSFEEESTICTLDGEVRQIMGRLAVGAGYEQTWERCFLSLLDITDRKRAEDALRHSQEETILARRSALEKLSTPVIPISDRIIVMPLVGTLDTMRMQQVMTALLDEVQRTRAAIAILDITGVPEMDAEAANGIILAAQAVRLLGAQVVLTGIQPVVARRLIELDFDLSTIVTRGTLQTGISYAMGAEGSLTR